MTKQLMKAKEILKDNSGQGLAEYGLLIAGIALVVLIAVFALGGVLKGKFTDIGNKINSGEGTSGVNQ